MGELQRSEYKSKLVEQEPVRKLQSQGVHHITLVGATGRRRSTSGKACSACRSSSSSRTSTTSPRATSTSTRATGGSSPSSRTRSARPTRSRTLDRHRLRAPPRVLALAGDVPAGGGAARRARDPALGREGPRLHGLDLLRGPARPADRARVVPLRAAVRAHARRRAARGAQAARGARRLQHRPGAPRRRDRGARRTLARIAVEDRSPKNPYAERRSGHGHEHAEHPQAERQQPDDADLRAGRRARVRGGRTSGGRSRRRSSSRRTRPT